MILRALSVAAVLSLLLAGPLALAQGTTAGTRVSNGDILRIDVEGRADISGNFAVDKDGYLVLPILGRVAAANRTTSEIGTDIARRMSLISSKITQATVTMAQVASKRNFVLGAVLLPGMYIFKESPTVWDAITEAGGPTDDADLTAVEVLSETQPKPVVVDVTAGSTGDTSKLVRLKPGDTVRVPRTGAGGLGGEKGTVFVFGAVTQQGNMPLGIAPDLVGAFLRAGPTPESDYKNVEIVRKNGPQIVTLKVSMAEYFQRGDIAGNPNLQSGDTIHFNRLKTGFRPLSVVPAAASVLGLLTSILVLSR